MYESGKAASPKSSTRSAAGKGRTRREHHERGNGRTNLLQSFTNLSGGCSNVTANIVLAGTGYTTTNYLDVGVVTNATTRYYRLVLP